MKLTSVAALCLLAAVVSARGPGAQVQVPSQAGLIRDVAPRTFAMVVRADGAVIAWGQDPYGGGVKSAPVVVDLPGKALKVAVSIDSQTAYALLEDGSVVAWGQNDEGQLGTGVPGQNGVLGIYPKPSIAPVKVSGLRDIIEIGAGRKHGVALRRDGTVWAWGTRDDGVLGDGDTKPAGSLRVVSALAPIPVPGLVDIVHIAVGPNHNLALRRDGRVMSWGRNNGGELGLGTRATGWMPAEVVGLERIVAVAAGNAVTNGVSGAVRDDGTVWMWGVNTSAMMGNGQEPTAPDDEGGRNLLPDRGVTLQRGPTALRPARQRGPFRRDLPGAHQGHRRRDLGRPLSCPGRPCVPGVDGGPDPPDAGGRR